MRILSYNLRNHRAIHEVHGLAVEYDPDMICLQEADTSQLPETVGELRLADATKNNRLGLAIYFRDDRFKLRTSRTYRLQKSLHDRTLSPAHERLLAAAFTDRKHEQPLIVGSFHASPLTTLNLMRRRQISASLGKLRALGKSPTVLIGDFNYPWFSRKLGERMLKSGYLLSKGSSRTYTRYKVFRGYYDFAMTRDLRIEGLQTLPQGASDHMPVLLTAEFLDDLRKAGEP